MIILLSLIFGISFSLLIKYLGAAFPVENGTHSPPLPLYRFFESLLKCLSRYLSGFHFGLYGRHVGTLLSGAGVINSVSTCDFICYQVLLGVTFFSVTLLLGFDLFNALFFFTAGVFFPLVRLYHFRKKRFEEVFLELPHILDSLTLSVEAGLDFMTALDRTAKRWRDSALVQELRIVIKEFKTGGLKVRALKNLAERLPILPIKSFVTLIVQAEVLGVSIGPLLRAHASRLRRERFQEAERKGRAAAQKLLFPLVICIMPGVFVVIFGPLVVRLLTGGLI